MSFSYQLINIKSMTNNNLNWLHIEVGKSTKSLSFHVIIIVEKDIYHFKLTTKGLFLPAAFNANDLSAFLEPMHLGPRNGFISQSWPVLTGIVSFFLKGKEEGKQSKMKICLLCQGTNIFQGRILPYVEKHMVFGIRSGFKKPLILESPSLWPRSICFLNEE